MSNVQTLFFLVLHTMIEQVRAQIAEEIAYGGAAIKAAAENAEGQ